MRVLIVNNFYPPRRGGSALFAEHLASYYSLNASRVFVLTTNGKSKEISIERNSLRNLVILRLPSWILPKNNLSFNFNITFALRFKNFFRIKYLFRSIRPDVIHLHGQFLDLTWQYGIYARIMKIPTCLTIHTRLVNPNKIVNFLFRILDFFVVYPLLILINPASIIAIDSEMIKYICQRYPRFTNKIKFIPIGVNTNIFKFEHNITKNDEITNLKIASIGHVIAIRDRVLLTNAVAKLLEKGVNLSVDIIGEIYITNFIRIIKKDIFEKIFTLHGVQNEKFIKSILKESDVEVHDVQGFGLGIATLEAMSLGVPVIIAINADYFPHAPILNDYHAIIIRPNNLNDLVEALEKLNSNHFLRNQLSINGSKYVKDNFDLDIICSMNYNHLLRLVS